MTESELSPHSRRAYASDWKHFSAWARREGQEVFTPSTLQIAAYLRAGFAAAPSIGGRAFSKTTALRRLSALQWNYAQRGGCFDRDAPEILDALALAPKPLPHSAPKITTTDLEGMIATLDLSNLRGLRDRAMLLLGAGAKLRRSELTGLDLGNDAGEGQGWLQLLEQGAMITVKRKSRWERIELTRGSSPNACPVIALEVWLKYARIKSGPLFRRVRAAGREVADERLNDKEVARLVKRCAAKAALRSDLSTQDLKNLYSSESLRSCPNN